MLNIVNIFIKSKYQFNIKKKAQGKKGQKAREKTTKEKCLGSYTDSVNKWEKRKLEFTVKTSKNLT